MKQTYEFLKQAAINSMVISFLNENDTYFGQAHGFVSAANLIVTRHKNDKDMLLLTMSDIVEQAEDKLKR